MDETCPLHVVQAGSGGVDEMNKYVDEREVQWALLRFEIGSGAFRRQHALFFHMNGQLCPAVRRGKANEFTTDALHILRGRGHNNFHASVQVTTEEEVTKELLIDKISSSVIVDHGDHSAQWIMEQYERQIKENATKPLPMPSSSGKESSEDGRTIPGYKQYSKPFSTGREALKGVSQDLGLWNWVLVGPDDKELPLISGGDGSLDEMVGEIQNHQSEVLFGLLRLGFGTGRLRRTKHIFIHTVGPQVGAVKRGQLSNMRPKVQQVMHKEQCANVTCAFEVIGIDGLTIDEVIDKVRRAAIVDDAHIGKDDGTRTVFSEAAFRNALEEERRIIAEKAAEQKQTKAKVERSEVKWATSEAVELVHRPGGPLNWALFGYKAQGQSKVKAMQAPLAPNPGMTQIAATGLYSGWRRKDQAFIAFDVIRYAVQESAGKVTLMVKRSGDLSRCILVDFRTDPGSALPGDGEDDPGDYVETAGTLEFLPEETTKEIDVEIIDDDEFEDDEEFYVVLHSARCPDGGVVNLEKDKSTATVLIIDDDDPGWLQFANDTCIEVFPDATVDGIVSVMVERQEGCKGSISCSYTTEDDTAKAGDDYVAASGVLVFGPSEMTAIIEVNIKSRARYEALDLFRIVLFEPVGGTRFSKERDGGPPTISQTVAITSFAESAPSTLPDEGEEDVLSMIDSFWSESGKASFRPMEYSKASPSFTASFAPVQVLKSGPGLSFSASFKPVKLTTIESFLMPSASLMMPPRSGDSPPLPSPLAAKTLGGPSAADMESPKDAARRLSRVFTTLSADGHAMEEAQASDDLRAKSAKKYADMVLNPIFGSLLEACLSGQPSDTRGFMIMWLTARSAGAPLPIAEASSMQLSLDAYAAASISPLLGPLASELLRVLPADPIPMMIQYLGQGARLRSLSDFLSADPEPEVMPIPEPLPQPRLTGALLMKTRPRVRQQWQLRYVELGPTGRFSWWHSPHMATAGDVAEGYIELKGLTVQRGKGSEFSVTAEGGKAITFDTATGQTSWPGPTSNGNQVTHKLTASNWAKIIEYEVNRMNKGCDPLTSSGMDGLLAGK